MAKVPFLLIAGLLASFTAFVQPEIDMVTCQNDDSTDIPASLMDFKEKSLIKVNPFFIDIYQPNQTDNHYTVEFFEDDFKENGRFHDYNFFQAEPRVAHMLIHLRSLARETSSYIFLNPAGFTKRTCYKKIKEKYNYLHHDSIITTRAISKRFYELTWDEKATEKINWQKIKLTFRPTGMPIPLPKKFILRADDIRETFKREGFLWLKRTVTGYTLTVKKDGMSEEFDLALDQLSKPWRNKLKDLWSLHGNTWVSFNEYMLHPMANADVGAHDVFRIEELYDPPAKSDLPEPTINETLFHTMYDYPPTAYQSQNTEV